MVGTIPWAKIVYSKTLLSYHDNICHWDDSAAEEAFQNAKKRFWADVNGLPCDISLPDPDSYMDKINWNQAIDPELIKDLDKQYFNPDDVEEDEEMGSKKKRVWNLVGSPCDRCDVNLKKSRNPWEINNLHHGEEVKNVAWSTNSCDKETREPGHLHSDDNPWEQSNSQGNWVRKENEWADGVNISGWNQWGGDPNQQNSRNSENDEKWAKTALNSSEWNAEMSRKFSSSPDAMDYGYIREDRASKDGRWRENVATTSRNWKHWDKLKDEQKSSRRTWVPRDGEASRKRGSSHQHSSRYRSPGYRGGDKQANQYWSSGRDNKRVSFALH
ncbi:Cytokinin dehydrogenase [Psidium guajava]|nr:Cytokinin dehydrogenase [Psidium guajava]